MAYTKVKKGHRPEIKPRKRRVAKWYFFLNGELHKVIRDHRGTDLMLAWNFPQHKMMHYISSEVHKQKESAFTVSETAQLINRKYRYLDKLAKNGTIIPPYRAYRLSDQADTKSGIRFWSESDIVELHKHFSQQARGRPRKDGYVFPQELPSLPALRAAMRNQEMLYVRTKTGDFIPVWDQGVYGS